MENFEQILKKELGVFEKHFIDFRDDMKNEISSFKTEIRDEIYNFESKMENQMDELKTAVTDEIRERFFCFENDYGIEIDAVYDKVILDKEVTDIRLKDLEEHIKKSDMRILDNSIQIDSVKKENVNSKV